MKKRWIAVIMCLLLLLTAAACGKEEDGPSSLLNNNTSETEQSASDSETASDDSRTEENDTDSKSSSASKKEKNSDSSSQKGGLSEKQALSLVFEQAEEDYGEGSGYVDKSSGVILDQNKTAYIVAFEVGVKGHEENNFQEAYWINKKTREIRDVCGINEYFEGMIDITNGTALF